mgnify:CR=1 FL=1
MGSALKIAPDGNDALVQKFKSQDMEALPNLVTQ